MTDNVFYIKDYKKDKKEIENYNKFNNYDVEDFLYNIIENNNNNLSFYISYNPQKDKLLNVDNYLNNMIKIVNNKDILPFINNDDYLMSINNDILWELRININIITYVSYGSTLRNCVIVMMGNKEVMDYLQF